MMKFFAVVSTGRKQKQLEIEKILLEKKVESDLKNIFENQADSLEQKDLILFQGSYTTDKSEAFSVSPFELDELFTNAWDRYDALHRFSLGNGSSDKSLKAIFGIEKIDNNFNYYFQAFQNTRLLTKSRITLLISGQTYNRLQEDAFIIDNKLAAIFYSESKTLIFNSYAVIRQFINITEYFQEASTPEIKEILEGDFFHCSDNEAVANFSDDAMRKLFTGLKILLPQIEEKTTPTKIKRIAKKYDISIDIIKTADDKKQINFPIEKREAKNLLKFLNEQMYTGELTQLQYHSNSQAVLPTSANEETQSDNTEQ